MQEHELKDFYLCGRRYEVLQNFCLLHEIKRIVHSLDYGMELFIALDLCQQRLVFEMNKI